MSDAASRPVLNLKDLKEKIGLLGLTDEEQIKTVVCALIGHSRICTVCFGYRNCGRCGDQLGDNLGGTDMARRDCVIIAHNCPKCRSNYKKMTWRDKYLTPNPFK